MPKFMQERDPNLLAILLGIAVDVVPEVGEKKADFAGNRIGLSDRKSVV